MQSHLASQCSTLVHVLNNYQASSQQFDGLMVIARITLFRLYCTFCT